MPLASVPTQSSSDALVPSDPQRLFEQKYGPAETRAWGPAMRWRWGYYNPDDRYEQQVARLVGPDTAWLDVGCGRHLFPSNRPLAEQLARTCRRLAGVDPDPTLAENPHVHERFSLAMDAFDGAEDFDLITLRMVAEHVEDPAAICAAIARSLRPGGICIIYTVHRFAPVPLLTRLIPMPLRHPLKRLLWGTARKDTFPTRFRLNCRSQLRRAMQSAGLAERSYELVDDCRTFAQFRIGQLLELSLWRCLKLLRLPFPERCILASYRKPPA